MKLSKLLLSSTLAAALVLGFAGCSWDSGDGDTTGNKWSLKMNINIGTQKEDAKTNFRRYWKQIGSLQQVEQIETKITVYKDGYVDEKFGTVSNKNNSVIGLAFGLNKDSDIKENGSKDTLGFYLLGYSPEKGFYLEQYDEVAKQAETLDTNNGALTKTDNTTSAQTKSYDFSNKKWVDAKTYWNNKIKTSTDADGNTVFYVILKQTGNGINEGKTEKDERGNYQVYIADKELSKDEVSALDNKSSYFVAECEGQVFDSDGSAQGGIAVYGNAKRDGETADNIIALYEQYKDTLEGALYDEIIEE